MNIKRKVSSVIKKFGKEKTTHSLFRNLDPNNEYKITDANPIFITGTGRSGTHFFAELFGRSKQLRAYHLDDVGDSIGDSFQVYLKWNNLPIDSRGFIQSRGFLIDSCFRDNLRYLESNPLIAFSLVDLYNSFGGKILVTIRNPRKVIESHFLKGWYSSINVADESITGYQYFHERPNHFFSRILPRHSDELAEWISTTRLGRLSWMWYSTYIEILNQLKVLPEENYSFVYLDNLDFPDLADICSFLNLNEFLSAQDYKSLVRASPGKGVRGAVIWDEASKTSFNKYVSRLIELLPYNPVMSSWLFKE